MIKYFALWMLALATAASAQNVMRIPGKVVLSQDLVDALFQRLSQDPYNSVAQLLAKLQAEVAPQLAPAPPQPTPEPKPDDKK